MKVKRKRVVDKPDEREEPDREAWPQFTLPPAMQQILINIARIAKLP